MTKVGPWCEGERSHATDKILYILYDGSKLKDCSFFFVGLNCKVAKSDKFFLKEKFGEGTMPGEIFEDGNYLPWNAALTCPLCETQCKNGHFSVQIMVHLVTGHMRLSEIPRLWHFQCITPLSKAKVTPNFWYPPDQCKTVSVEEAWAMADRDVQEATAKLLNAVNEITSSTNSKSRNKNQKKRIANCELRIGVSFRRQVYGALL
eukprot:Phypoly_transcript_09578.p1 GENE.Phypoly_transcript_09578~~Phypoly_transcript_09578.p1  ORF type:complete len:205 (+),score=17.68 Phypoly_transcript_09578:596-1210(+)